MKKSFVVDWEGWKITVTADLRVDSALLRGDGGECAMTGNDFLDYVGSEKRDQILDLIFKKCGT